MKKLVAIMSLLSFVGVLSLSSAVAQTVVNGCVKEKGDGSPKKNAKINRAAVDDSVPCKSKEVAVSLPTTNVTSDLQSQINSNDTDIANNAANIATNATNIATNTTNIATNASDIADVQSQVDAIATVIGGSSGSNDLPTIDETRYMGMFVGRLRTSDRNTENRMPVAGTVTNFWVRQAGPDPLTGNANRVFTVLLRQGGALNDPVPTALTCTLALPDNEFACSDDVHCANVIANRRINIEIDNNPNTGTLGAVETNWSAKFTPGATCPVL